MRALLDVNVLIALLDENHAQHTTASEWFEANIEHGWASCPLTQNGCVRILSQPRYPNVLGAADDVMRLRIAVSTPWHRVLPDDVSLLDDHAVDRHQLLVPRQLTDVYLLALAVAHGARFVTLDRSVPLGAVRRATKASLIVI